MNEQQGHLYPPDTDDIDELARFFDTVDSTQLAGLEEVKDFPVRDLVNVSLRLPRRDLEHIKRVAAAEGLPPTTFIRWLLRRFVRSMSLRELREEEARQDEAERKAG